MIVYVVVGDRYEFRHSSENIDKVLMFVSCIRLRFRHLIAVLALFIGYLVWFAWSFGIRHKESTEAYVVADKNGLKSKSHAVKDQLVPWHDLQTSAQEKLLGANSVNVSKLFVRDNVNSLQFNLSDKLSSSGGSNAARSATLCNDECVRFRNILLNWPEDKPKAAVYYLAKADRLHLLNNSLTSLYNSFLYSFDYPVIVFHEADSHDLVQWKFRQLGNIRLFLQEVQFTIPDHVHASAVRFDIKCLSYVSYRHMCRFHAKQVYEQPILVGLDYVWRLDDDSLLPASINYDLFVFMHHRHFQYGYIKIHIDSYDCTVGLWDAAKRYVKLKHIQSSYFDKWTEPKIFYNNFEISALSLWTSKQYQDYINFIDSLGGIYYYRWGDAPIKSIAVTLFLPETATHLFTDITYQHGHFFKNVSYSSF